MKGDFTMLRKIENEKMGSSDLGWFKSKFHFSFAEYYDPNNMGSEYWVIFVLELEENNEIDYSVEVGRQAYLVQIEGKSTINGITLDERDAMEIIEENINIKA